MGWFADWQLLEMIPAKPPVRPIDGLRLDRDEPTVDEQLFPADETAVGRGQK